MRFQYQEEADAYMTAGLAQSVERWSHNPKVVSSILTPGKFCVDEL
jgi:hypothetical protein